jgi:gluconate 5-dehydrogenase
MGKIFSVQNKVIIITGATGYLGSKMVEHLTLAGAKVIVLSTDITKSKKLCEILNLPENQAFEIDISSKNSIRTVFKDIYNTFSVIDVLVNNAYFGVAKEFNSYTQEDWHKSLDGTIVSIDMTTQAVTPYMTKNHAGRIINISSMYGMVAPDPSAYPPSIMMNPLSYGVGKAGIIQYTKYSAMMLAKNNITVNTISYGAFPNIDNVKDKAFLQNLANKTFLQRIGKPEEVTSAIHFLSLDESSYITGQNIIVDGGWTSW